ncbi:hypothetical protein DYQ86_27245 [Acidobacteria bacterium AB60]|nr:hypothetical protein DYQ86_27245 [Acidobacteria bacterium AB60]
MKVKAMAIPALAFALAAPAGWMSSKAYAASPAQPASGFYQERGWDEPPEEFRDAQRRGFHEGIEAARRDADHHSRKDADDHEMYKHPPVERELRNDFREGFRRGYQTAMDHMRSDHRDHDHDDHPY